MEMRHGGFDKVVSLLGKASHVKYPAIDQVDAYWESLRKGRLMPDRSEVDPRGLGTALEYAFLLEQIAPGIGRVRISGLHLRDLLGMEVRGMPLTAFFVPESRARVSEVMEAVVTTPKLADISISSAPGLGKPALHARLFMAPLSNAGERGARVLCCLQTKGQIGRTPRRFSVDKVQMRRIVPTAGAPEPTTNPAVTPARLPDRLPEPSLSTPGFAAPRATFEHKKPAPRRDATAGTRDLPPYLRLVKND